MRYPFLVGDPDGDVDIEIVAEGLCFVNEAGRSATIDWKRIRQVRLYCGPSPAETMVGWQPDLQPSWFCCEIHLRGARKITLSSLGFSTLYRGFVLALHERLHANRSRARFRAGLTWPGFLRQLILPGAWLYAGGIFGGTSWGGAATGVIGLLHEGTRTALLRNLPRRYRPDRVPERVLPPKL